MFNSKLFPHVGTRTQSGSKFLMYQSQANSMILFSVTTGKPLVALTFSTRNDPESARETLIFPSSIDSRPAVEHRTQNFQGLIKKDKQEIALILTNITEYHIRFNIVNNGRNINQINVLGPYQTYKVESDHQYDNTSIILESVKEIQADGSEKKLSVKQDIDRAKATSSSPKGTFLDIDVFPPLITDIQKAKEIETIFSTTKWKCVDYFLIEEPLRTISDETLWEANVPVTETIQRIEEHLDTETHRERIEYTDNDIDVDEDDIDEEDEEDEVDTNAGNLVDRIGDALLDDIVDDENEEYIEIKEKGIKFEIDELEVEIDELQVTRSVNCDQLQGMPPRLDDLSSFGSRDSSDITQKIINNSNAAEMKQGEKVEVKCKPANMGFNYLIQSPPCILGLSVEEDLVFNEKTWDVESNEVQTIFSTMVDQYVKKKYEEFLMVKIFPNGDCVVCLCEDANMIFYRCGHQCVHPGCDPDNKLEACPMCREKIVARRTISNAANKLAIKSLQEYLNLSSVKVT